MTTQCANTFPRSEGGAEAIEPNGLLALVLMIGAYLYAHSDAHRLAEVSRGVCDPNDLDEMPE
jgi:hypothetical protein